MIGCELCSGAARLYCESDTASLCFECDAKVHGANFLVARHQRILLCRACHRPTPWRASGAHLGPTVSVCSRCHPRPPARDHEGESRGNREEREGEDDDGSDDVAEEEEDEEEEEEEQVVPWETEKETASAPAASSSSSELESAETKNGVLKRRRENAVDLTFSSSSSAFSSYHLFDRQRQAERNGSDTVDNEATSDSLRPRKIWKGGKTQFRSALQQPGSAVDITFSGSQPPPI